jgi:hypothetical protein
MGKRKTSGCSANTRDTAQFYACKLPPHRIPAASIQRRQQTRLRLELDNECRGSAESKSLATTDPRCAYRRSIAAGMGLVWCHRGLNTGFAHRCCRRATLRGAI